MRRIFRVGVLVAASFLVWVNAVQSELPKPGSPELRVLNWRGLIDTRTIPSFESFSARVVYEAYASNEELRAKLKAGASYDVVFPSTYMVQILIREGLLQTLDKSRLPNLSHLSKQFLHWPFDPENRFSLPYLWGTTGLGINHERVRGSRSAVSNRVQGKDLHVGGYALHTWDRSKASWFFGKHDTGCGSGEG